MQYFLKRLFVIGSILSILLAFVVVYFKYDVNVSISSIYYSFSSFFISRGNGGDGKRILKIPQIDLVEEFYPIGSDFNDVDYHVQLLDSSLPSKRLYFFAAHSGYGGNCFFNDIIYLKQGDEIYVVDDNITNLYLVVDKYYIDKSGYLEIFDNFSDYVYLITCSLEYKGKQLVIVGRYVSS